MPSSRNRKKNKGKERKAKKEEAERVDTYNIWQGLASVGVAMYQGRHVDMVGIVLIPCF